MKLEVKKLVQSAKLPTAPTNGDAGIDLYLLNDTLVTNESQLVATGIAVAIPEGHVGLVVPRSSTGVKLGIFLSNSVGVIDSQYRGELKLPLVTRKFGETVSLKAGDKIAQLLIIECPSTRAIIVEKEELSETVRGTGGFGSTGAV